MARDEAYYRAEGKIEAAQRSGATKLDLSNMELTELPESIEHLKQLQLLDLSDNKLAAQSESLSWLSTLTQLRELNICKNHLTKLPESLRQLSQLHTLNLFSNQLTVLPESLGGLTQLQELDLGGNQLTTLPESLKQLTQLQSLSLYANQLTTLSESLGYLTQLRLLEISFNQLTSLPESLGRLTQLQSLNIGENKLAVLPEWLCSLVQLRELMIFSNQLTALPKSLAQLTKLEIFSISVNRFISLPNWIGYFENLRELYASHNDIETLPDTISNLNKLEVLVLGGGGVSQNTTYQLESYKNRLTDIHLDIENLPNLKKLDLSGNPLNPELAEAYKKGLGAVKTYLHVQAYLRAKNIANNFLHQRTLKVFLCHASQDKSIVHELYQKLSAEKWIEPWLDAKKLLPGQDWQAEIKNAVETADNVIIFLSHTSINKDGFIQKELRLAKDLALEKTEGSIFLIPLRLDDCDVPKSLQIYQWANYFGEEQEQSYANLLASLRFRLDDLLRREALVKPGS